MVAVGYAEAVYSFQIPGDAGPAQVAIGLDNTGDFSAAAIVSLLAAIPEGTTGLMAFTSPFVVMQDILVRARRGLGDPEVASQSVNFPGTGSGEMEPPQVAVLVQKISGLAGRANRGRSYFVGPVAAGITEAGLLTTTYRNQWQGAVTAYFDELATQTIPMVILHTNDALTPTPVTAYTVGSKVATQRRRLR